MAVTAASTERQAAPDAAVAGAALYRRAADWAPTGVEIFAHSDPLVGTDTVGPRREMTHEEALIECLSTLAPRSLSE